MHRFSGGRRFVAIGVAIAMVLGCGRDGAVAPAKTSVIYRLTSIDNVALPITDTTIHSGIITAGRFTLVGSDSAIFNQTDSEPSSNGNPPTVEIEVGISGVNRSGSMLVLEPTYGALVDTAFLNGNTITLDRHVPFAGVARVRVYNFATP